jgi:hypothetical protein
VNRLLPDLIIFDVKYNSFYNYRQDLDFKNNFILVYHKNVTIKLLNTMTEWNAFGKLSYKISQGIL